MTARNTISLRDKRGWITKLRAFYRDPAKDPYDPDHLWECWEFYWSFLYDYGDEKLTECTPIQWKAYEIAIKTSESADWRTRRGGKSLSMANLGV